MDIQITDRRYNELLEREEIRFEIVHEGEPTPKIRDVAKLLCATINSKPELTVIDGIESQFGMARSRGFAKVYKDVSRLRNVEPKHILAKNFEEESEEESGQEE